MQLAKVVIASALVLAIYAQGLPEGKKKKNSLLTKDLKVNLL